MFLWIPTEKKCKQALEKVRKACNKKGYYVVDADIEKFFDNVNQDKLMKLAEKTGRGVPKITEKYGKDAFEFRENAIVVKIPFNWINVMGNKLGDKMGNKVGNKSASSTEQDIHLNETQLKILNFIRDNNNITKKQLQEKTSKSKTTVDNTISFLREHGLIERIGSNKTGYWRVND